MDCKKIKQLLTFYLDEELTAAEHQTIQSHLNECLTCRKEYEELSAIVAALRQIGNGTITVPIGFKDAVMQQIRAENKSAPISLGWKDMLLGKWRYAAAATAAALVLTMAGVGINFIPPLQMADNNSPGNQPQVITDKGDYQHHGANKNSNNSNTNPSFSKPGAPSDIEEIENDNNENCTPKDSLTENQPYDKPSEMFLNREQVIKTTVLKVQVADSAAALSQAQNIATAAGASTQSLGQQVTEDGLCSTLKITVAKSAAAGLLHNLKELGHVTSQEVDKKDITSQFAQDLDKYQALVAERETAQDDNHKAQLEQQIKKLEDELNSLQASAQKETIILWLEN